MAQKEFRETRDADFKRAVGRVMTETRGERLTMGDAVRRAIKGGAPYFYISYDYAYRHLSLYRRGLKRGGKREAMWAEIDRRVRELGERRRGAPVSRLLAEVLMQGRATRFFITERYGMRVFNELGVERVRN